MPMASAVSPTTGVSALVSFPASCSPDSALLGSQVGHLKTIFTFTT